MKRAIVTGCSRGIGAAVTVALLQDGWDVAGISRTRLMLPNIEHLTWCPIDIASPLAGERLGQTVGEGPLDALIHCAAIQGPIGLFSGNDQYEWEMAIWTNLIGTATVVRACLPALQCSDDARILLFSGGGAFNPRPNYSAYAASKAGVVSLMETLADELLGTNVTVNAVSPGFVPTGIDPHAPVLAHDPDGAIAMERAVACVHHLLSPQARGLTSRTISAEFDDWQNIDETTVVALNASVMGTRYRHPIAQLQAKARARTAV